MNTQDKKKLAELNQSELAQKVAKLQTDIALAKLAIRTGKEKNLRRAYNLRHQVSVINTIISRQKENL